MRKIMAVDLNKDKRTLYYVVILYEGNDSDSNDDDDDENNDGKYDHDHD